MWHFCGTMNSNKLEKLRERSLRILHNDFESHIQNLMDESGQETLLSNRLKYLILEVFKSIRKSNAPCLHDIFVLKEVPYDLRTPKLEQPNRRTTNYGLRTFSYLGSKLWNEFLSDFNYTCDTDLDELKFFLKRWEGPSLDPHLPELCLNLVGWSTLWSRCFTWVIFYMLWLDFLYIYYLDSIIYLYVHNDVALYILHFSKSYTSLLANVVCC